MEIGFFFSSEIKVNYYFLFFFFDKKSFWMNISVEKENGEVWSTFIVIVALIQRQSESTREKKTYYACISFGIDWECNSYRYIGLLSSKFCQKFYVIYVHLNIDFFSCWMMTRFSFALSFPYHHMEYQWFSNTSYDDVCSSCLL